MSGLLMGGLVVIMVLGIKYIEYLDHRYGAHKDEDNDD